MDARQMYEKWLRDFAQDPDLVRELTAIAGDDKEIEDRFYRGLEFGTAGMRGVIGYGTNELPAFYTRKSGFGVDYELDTPEELAAAFHAERELGMKNGMLVTNPIPEKYSMDHKVIDKAIEQALAEAKAQGIHGKETTPFLLAKVKDLTGGDSLESNIQLVYNNAVLGAKTACALAALKD